MKAFLAAFLLVILTCVSADAARRSSSAMKNSRVALGVRYHQVHSAIKRWPYEDGNLSYGASYALYDGMGYLELGLDYAPEGIADTPIDEVWTPRLNMAILDGIFVAGIGIANGYVRKTGGGSEWTGLLYQFHLGLEIPIWAGLEIGGGAYYSFDDWRELGDYVFEEMEYGIRLGYRF